MSEFKVEVVRVGPVEKHPNADTLSITNVHGGYPCIFRTGDFKEGDLATYIPVDALVPSSRPEFAFLGTDKPRHRIKAKRLRKIFSMGLLVPPPPGAEPGTDVRTHHEVEKYEPEMEREPDVRKFDTQRPARRSETIRFDAVVWSVALIAALVLPWYLGPACALAAYAASRFNRKIRKRPNVPVYDIEGWRKHKHAFVDGEQVWVTEKIHGCNARYMHNGFKFFVGSRTQWRDGDSLWHKAAERYSLAAKLKKHPHIVLFGEIFGPQCQDLDYGVPNGEVDFIAFDAMDSRTRRYLNVGEFVAFCRDIDVPVVPTLYYGPWSEDVLKLAEGHTILGNGKHVREGFVVRPIFESETPGLGRKQLKLAGEGYLLR